MADDLDSLLGDKKKVSIIITKNGKLVHDTIWWVATSDAKQVIQKM